MDRNGQLWRSRRISPLCFSSKKIHCKTMSIDKDMYLTPSQSMLMYERTSKDRKKEYKIYRSSHNSQYCRPQTYSDALKYSFSPRTIGNSQPPSVVTAESTEEFRAPI